MIVNELGIKFVKLLTDVSGVEDQAVTFECDISKAKWKKSGQDVIVKWFKGERELRETSKYAIRRDGVNHSLTIKQLAFEDVADYSAVCLAEKTSGKLTIQESGVTFTSKLKDVQVNEKEMATFECDVSKTHSSKSNELLPVVWCKKTLDDKEDTLVKDARVEFSAKNKKLILKIDNTKPEDAGVYVVCIGGIRAEANLTVNEIPVVFKRPLEDQRAREGQSCVFECVVNRIDKPVKWFVNGKLVSKEDISSGKYVISQEKGRLQLKINNLELEKDNECEITCQVGDKANSKAKLRVEEDDIKFIERLVDSGIKENEPVQLVCKLSKLKYVTRPNQELSVKWFIKGKEVN